VLRHGAWVRVRELRAAGDVVDDPAVVSAADPTKRQVRAFGCCRTCRHPSSLTHRPPPGPSTGGLLAPQPATFEQRALRWARSASFDQSASVALEKRQNSVAAATAICPSSACKIRTIAPQLWAKQLHNQRAPSAAMRPLVEERLQPFLRRLCHAHIAEILGRAGDAAAIVQVVLPHESRAA
jgi:hypothetical protein